MFEFFEALSDEQRLELATQEEKARGQHERKYGRIWYRQQTYFIPPRGDQLPRFRRKYYLKEAAAT